MGILSFESLLPRRKTVRLYWLTSDLAISGTPGKDDWRGIEAAGIRCVVDLREESRAVADLCLNYRELPIREGHAPESADLRAITDWIAARIMNAEPVLVYCREGRGRSALVACATLVRLGMPVGDAYLQLKRARPEAQLSDEQVSALEAFARAATPFVA